MVIEFVRCYGRLIITHIPGSVTIKIIQAAILNLVGRGKIAKMRIAVFRAATRLGANGADWHRGRPALPGY